MIAERFGGPAFLRRITPSQAIEIETDNAAQQAQIVNARAAMAFGNEGDEAHHLRVGQPEQAAHDQVSSQA